MNEECITIQGITKEFRGKYALEDISFTIEPGQTIGLIGESGSGKSTLAKLLMRLIYPTKGQISYKGEDIFLFKGWPKIAQIVFQNPHSSLNPKMKVQDLIAEPLVIHKVGDEGQRHKKVLEMLDLVQLDSSLKDRFPCQISGGQKQRVAIARALALEPKLLICDESFSGLDASTQKILSDLLSNLQKEQQFSCLFITHDIRLVKRIAQHTGVLYKGKLIELGPTSLILSHPKHAYTTELIRASIIY